MIKICLQGNKFLFLKSIMCYSHKHKKQPEIPLISPPPSTPASAQTLQGQRLSLPVFFVPQRKGQEAEVWGPRAEGVISRGMGTAGRGVISPKGLAAVTAQMDGPLPWAESELSGQPHGKKRHPLHHGSEQKRDLVSLPPPLWPHFAFGAHSFLLCGEQGYCCNWHFQNLFSNGEQ